MLLVSAMMVTIIRRRSPGRAKIMHFKLTLDPTKVHNLTQWEIDPGIVEDAPVAALQVVNA